MKPSAPKVSVGLPVYNGENFLRAALESLVNQTFTDFEVIVSDNCSTDGSLEIAREFERQDSRVRCIAHEQNLGAVPNFNGVFSHAKGEYFKWAAHDDVLEPEFLASCVNALDADRSSVLAYPRAAVIDQNGDVIEQYTASLDIASPDPTRRFKDLLLSWHRCYEIFGLFRASSLRRTQLLPSYWGGDRSLLMEVALQGPFIEIPDFLFHPRSHAEQSITKMRGKNVDRTVWSDTRTRGKVVFPAWAEVSGNLSIIRQSELSLEDQALLTWYVLRWARRNSKVLSRDIARGLRAAVRQLATP